MLDKAILLVAAATVALVSADLTVQECPDEYKSFFVWNDGAVYYDTEWAGDNPPDVWVSHDRYSSGTGYHVYGWFVQIDSPAQFAVTSLPPHEGLIWQYSLVLSDNDWEGNDNLPERIWVDVNNAADFEDPDDWDIIFMTSVGDRGCFPFQCDNSNTCIGGDDNTNHDGATSFRPNGDGWEYLWQHDFPSHTANWTHLHWETVNNGGEHFGMGAVQLCLKPLPEEGNDSPATEDDGPNSNFLEDNAVFVLVGAVAVLGAEMFFVLSRDPATDKALAAATTKKEQHKQRHAPPSGSATPASGAAAAAAVPVEEKGHGKSHHGESGRKGSSPPKRKRSVARKASNASNGRKNSGARGKSRSKARGGSPTKGHGRNVSPSKVRFADLANADVNSVAPPDEPPPPLPPPEE